MQNKIAITGMGIVSALGQTVEATKNALTQSKSGISALQNIESIHKGVLQVGEINLTNKALTELLKLHDNNFTRTALLGALAATEAFKNADLASENKKRIGLISATTVGGMDRTERYFKTFESQPEKQKYISSHHAGDSTHKIAEALEIKGFTTTISTACSSSANAIMLGARMLVAGKVDQVLVGGTDALSKFTINGFNSLLLLSDSYCKPFDAARDGLNLGEASAYLVLERAEDVKDKPILAYLSGFANANDAHHQTASSENGEGAFLAMQKALQKAGLQPSQIDYINAHGTATPNNDLSESVALQRIFGDAVPDFSSTKPFTGHTLAAAGAVEAVFSVLALQENLVFPNLHFETKMPETQLTPVTKLKKKELNHVLSNSFGFGGNCSTLLFSKK